MNKSKQNNPLVVLNVYYIPLDSLQFDSIMVTRPIRSAIKEKIKVYQDADTRDEYTTPNHQVIHLGSFPTIQHSHLDLCEKDFLVKASMP